MKKLIRFWNIFHYNLYKWEVYVGNIINYPVRKILQNDYIKRKYAERGIENPEKIVTKTLDDSDSGVRVILAGAIIISLMFLIIYGFFNFSVALIKIEINLKLSYLLFMYALSIGINYFLLFRNNKYMDYFTEFNAMSKKEKNKYAWLSLLTVVIILSFTIVSFFIAN